MWFYNLALLPALSLHFLCVDKIWSPLFLTARIGSYACYNVFPSTIDGATSGTCFLSRCFITAAEKQLIP